VTCHTNLVSHLHVHLLVLYFTSVPLAPAPPPYRPS